MIVGRGCAAACQFCWAILELALAFFQILILRPGATPVYFLLSLEQKKYRLFCLAWKPLSELHHQETKLVILWAVLKRKVHHRGLTNHLILTDLILMVCPMTDHC